MCFIKISQVSVGAMLLSYPTGAMQFRKIRFMWNVFLDYDYVINIKIV